MLKTQNIKKMQLCGKEIQYSFQTCACCNLLLFNGGCEMCENVEIRTGPLKAVLLVVCMV